MKSKKWLMITLGAAILGCASQINRPLLAADLSPTSKRIEQLRSKWAQLRPAYENTPYKEQPALAPNFQPGLLQQSFLLDGLNTLNFARYLAGLPDDITIDTSLQQQAQCGALLMAHLKHLEHTPQKPNDFPDWLYKIAYASTSTSNISMGRRTLYDHIHAWVNDDGNPALGHRRWILYPPLKQTGMGFVNGFSTLQVLDKSRQQQVNKPFVAWPADGAHPIEFFTPNAMWSLVLMPTHYNIPDPGRVQIALRRIQDGKTWNFPGAGGYSNFNPPTYGDKNCLIFLPQGITRYNEGDQFEITASGLTDVNGQNAVLRYAVTFFKLENVVIAQTQLQHNLEQINAYRAQAGVPALQMDTQLNDFARQGSVELQQNHQSFGHYKTKGKGGSTGIWEEIQSHPGGWPIDGGLNATIDSLLQALMNTSSRDVILNPQFRSVGIGLVMDDDKLYLTNDFSQQAAQFQPASPTQPAPQNVSAIYQDNSQVTSQNKIIDFGAPLAYADKTTNKGIERVYLGPVMEVARWAGASVKVIGAIIKITRGNNVLTLKENSTTIDLTGTRTTTTFPTQSYNGRLYAPLGTLIQGMGGQIVRDPNKPRFNITMQDQPQTQPASQTPPTSQNSFQHNLAQINAYRAKAGVPALQMDTQLNDFAKQGSMELQQNHKPHGHFRGADVWNSGFVGGAAENQGDPNGWPIRGDLNATIDAILQSMMNEGPGGGHHDNMLNPEYGRVGIGLIVDGDKLYLTNDFSK